MFEHYLDILRNPKMINGVPQTGTALWEICKLIEAGLEFPEDEIPFIESLTENGHFEQQMMASFLLEAYDDK